MVLGREPPIVVGQLRVLDRRDKRPVMPNGTVLVPRHPEANRLERHTWQPDRRKEMTFAAAYDGVSSDPGVAPASGYRSTDRQCDHDYADDDEGDKDRGHALMVPGFASRSPVSSDPQRSAERHRTAGRTSRSGMRGTPRQSSGAPGCHVLLSWPTTTTPSCSATSPGWPLTVRSRNVMVPAARLAISTQARATCSPPSMGCRKDVVQDERDALRRGHRFEHDEEGHVDRLIEGDAVGRVDRGGVFGQRLGNPAPT